MKILNRLEVLMPFLKTAMAMKVMKSLFVFLVLWVVTILVHKIIDKNVKDVKQRYQWRKTSSYVVVVLFFIFVGGIWSEGIQSLATYFGLLSAGIAIALKDLIANLAGWIFIFLRRPFSVGDRIQINETIGDVIDASPFQFTVLEIGNWVASDQSTGRIIHIPNGKIFTEHLANYDKGFKYIWNEIPMLMTFESDWKKAKKILQKIADKNSQITSKKVESQIKKAAKKYMIYYNNLTPIVYTRIEDSGVMLTIRYLSETRNRRGSQEKIMEDVLVEFGKHKDIDFAYPTTRFYDNTKEGKR
jgi:small-conductance mechanosensitive channel